MKQNAPRSTRRGFSLLEMLIAMAMTAMLALSLYTAMHVAIRAKRSASASVDPTRVLAIASDLARQDLESALPPTGILAGPFVGVHQTTGEGDNDSIEFCAISRDEQTTDSPLSDGARRIELFVRTDLSPPALVREVTRNLLASSDPVVEQEVLCDGVRSFSLRYFDGFNWQETWDSTAEENTLPFAVMMTIVRDDQSGGSARTVSRVIRLSCAPPVTEGL